ncbi:MAG: hypothetical protein M3Z04_07905 [Chloroflexota bacterium]|nr:hypothetical protein [Chloroflexota bacterium]
MTSVALSPIPTYVGGPLPELATPGPTATWSTTWFDCGPARSSGQPEFRSCWHGTVAGVRLYLDAGKDAFITDPQQGLLVVAEADTVAPPDGFPVYKTPQRLGEVRIVAVNGTQVVLEPVVAPPAPVSFVFDLTTRQWLSGFPSASPVPSPSPLPSPSVGPSPLPSPSP